MQAAHNVPDVNTPYVYSLLTWLSLFVAVCTLLFSSLDLGLTSVACPSLIRTIIRISDKADLVVQSVRRNVLLARGGQTELDLDGIIIRFPSTLSEICTFGRSRCQGDHCVKKGHE